MTVALTMPPVSTQAVSTVHFLLPAEETSWSHGVSPSDRLLAVLCADSLDIGVAAQNLVNGLRNQPWLSS